MHYETIHTETASGFDIIFSVTPELDSPDWDFESEDEKRDLLARIESGDLAWFIARVQAFKNGVLLATNYLGGCCYDSPMQFVTDNDYYGDMVGRVISEARETIAGLCR